MAQPSSDEFLPIGVEQDEYQVSRRAKARNIIAIIRSQISELKTLSILDFGCHTGLMTVHLATAFSQTTGIDRNEKSIAAAKKLRSESNVEFRHYDGETLPFKNKSFDVVIANHVLYYVDDPQATIRELHRVMKDNSICYLSAMNGHYSQWIHMCPEMLRPWLLRTVLKSSLSTGNEIQYQQYLELFKNFRIIDFTSEILIHPKIYASDSSGIHQNFLFVLSFFPKRFLKLLSRSSPTFIFLLRK